jgi:hypothetical protein
MEMDKSNKKFYNQWKDYKFDYSPYRKVLEEVYNSEQPFYEMETRPDMPPALNFKLLDDTLPDIERELKTMLEKAPKLEHGTKPIGTRGRKQLMIKRKNIWHQKMELYPFFDEFIKKYYFDVTYQIMISVVEPDGLVALHEDQKDVSYRPDLPLIRKYRYPIQFPSDCYFLLEGYGPLNYIPGMVTAFDHARNHLVANTGNTRKIDISINFDYRKQPEILNKSVKQSLEFYLDTY